VASREAAPDGWLRVWRPRPEARLRLLCLPPAGAAAALYQPWTGSLPPYVELAAVEPPGRGSRYGEPYPTSFRQIVDPVLDALSLLPPKPVAVYGHSMGAIAALEIARALRDGGRPPVALLVSARNAPAARGADEETWPDLDDAQLSTLLRNLGGLDAEALDDPRLMATVLPVVRADIAVLAAYRYAPAPPLECPVRAYAGTGDTGTTPAGLALWRRENPADFRLHRVPGGHFFFRGHEAHFIARLMTDLTPVAAGARGPAWR
jgi:surfactin synthase thioesterase subunit